MKTTLVAAASLASLSLTSCASIEFNEGKTGGAPFYAPIPLIAVSNDDQCKATIQIQVMPDIRRPYVAIPHAGYGKNNLTAAFDNGLLKSFGQDTDTTSAADAIAKIAGLAGIPGVAAATGATKNPAGGGAPLLATGKCVPATHLYSQAADGHLVELAPPIASESAPAVVELTPGQPGAPALPPGLPATAPDTSTTPPQKPKHP